MSAYGHLPDLAPKGAEGRFMTQSVNREYVDLDRFVLVSPSYLGLEAIRTQTFRERPVMPPYRWPTVPVTLNLVERNQTRSVSVGGEQRIRPCRSVPDVGSS